VGGVGKRSGFEKGGREGGVAMTRREVPRRWDRASSWKGDDKAGKEKGGFRKTDEGGMLSINRNSTPGEGRILRSSSQHRGEVGQTIDNNPTRERKGNGGETRGGGEPSRQNLHVTTLRKTGKRDRKDGAQSGGELCGSPGKSRHGGV